MNRYPESLVQAQVYIAQNDINQVVANFLTSVNSTTSNILNAIISKTGLDAFASSACRIGAGMNTTDFSFVGFSEQVDKIEFYKSNLADIEKFIYEEAANDDLSIIERIEQVRKHYPKDSATGKPTPNDLEFLQGEMYDVFFDDDQTHEHYPITAAAIACEVIDTISDKFISFINQCYTAAFLDDATAPLIEAPTNIFSADCFDRGYKEGYEQAKLDIMQSLQITSLPQG